MYMVEVGEMLGWMRLASHINMRYDQAEASNMK